MNKLVINTANEDLNIVLSYKNEVFSHILNSKMHHNETMLPAIDELLKQHCLSIENIDEFGVVIGPGSFTGIRVGIATIKAFRDSLNIKAKGINNLDFLFKLANSQFENISIVAILGSRDSYFVARVVNGVLYKYERNLTLNELKSISDGEKIAMFKQDENLNCEVVKFDANILLECLNDSEDETLTPVYYQLSQAENEKIKRTNVNIEEAKVQDLHAIYEIEKSSISSNVLNENDIGNWLMDKNYITLVARMEDEVAGFVILQKTDEINIVSIAVKKEYRNKGIATKLIDEAERFAAENNISTLSLEVSKNNVTAYLLYDKMGFIVRRERKKYYSDGSDALEMFKFVQV